MKKLSLTLSTLTILFLNQHTYSETYKIDLDMYYDGVINQNYEVLDHKKLDEVLWRVNKIGSQRYPFKNGAISFYTAWIDTEGAHFKVSIDNVNSVSQLNRTLPKNKKPDEFFSQFLCGIGRDVPELYFSNFFKKTLSGNLKIDFLDENKKVYKTISENVENCKH